MHQAVVSHEGPSKSFESCSQWNRWEIFNDCGSQSYSYCIHLYTFTKSDQIEKLFDLRFEPSLSVARAVMQIPYASAMLDFYGDAWFRPRDLVVIFDDFWGFPKETQVHNRIPFVVFVFTTKTQRKHAQVSALIDDFKPVGNFCPEKHSDSEYLYCLWNTKQYHDTIHPAKIESFIFAQMYDWTTWTKCFGHNSEPNKTTTYHFATRPITVQLPLRRPWNCCGSCGRGKDKRMDAIQRVSCFSNVEVGYG